MNATSQQSLEPYRNPELPVDTRVHDLLSRMTLEEKAAQWVHNAPAVERLGIPAYNWWSECLHGVARAGYATVFPQAIGLAATWDPQMIERIGTAISDEARAKHHDFVRRGERGIYQGLTFWSPNINLFRDPRWGRGMETYGEDPFLTGKTGAAFIRGLQGKDRKYLKLVGTMKHFAVHSGPEPDRHTFDARVDERDLRESYLPHFRMCVAEANVQSVMCAYNRFAGAPCCGSDRLLARILRGEWAFEGYVTSDCGAIGDIYKGHKVATDAAGAAALAIGAGTDLNCSFDDAAPLEAVRTGQLKEADLDRSIARLYRARFRLGLFDPPERVPYASIPMSVVGSSEHRALALAAARSSIVLLRNQEDLLPLRKNLKRIAVIGPNADDVLSLLGNYYGVPESPVTPLLGIRSLAGKETEVGYAPGCAFAEGVPLLESVPGDYLLQPDGRGPGLLAEYFQGRHCEGTPVLRRSEPMVEHNWCGRQPIEHADSTHFSVRWSGSLSAPASGTYRLGTFGFRSFRLFLDDSLAASAERASEMPIYDSVSLEAGRKYTIRLEGSFRFSGSLVKMLWEVPGRDREQEALTLAKKSEVVILVLGLSPMVEGEEMNVAVNGFRGGDRTDIALPEVQERLLERVVALGKPVVLVLLNGSALAIPWAAEHVPAILESWYPGQDGGTALAEALFGGYNPGGKLPVTFYRSMDDLPPFDSYAMKGRTYRFFGGTPLFPFGHGLSYTRFDYRNFAVDRNDMQNTTGARITASVEVANVGARRGDEVVQLYVRLLDSRVPRPRKDLRGFQRITLEPGERRTVTFPIVPSDLEYYDTGAWHVEPGKYELQVGGSSEDIRGTRTITLR